jgi:hypothetical protein
MGMFDSLIEKITKTTDEMRRMAKEPRRWEYLYGSIRMEQLNEYGREGWELVHIDHLSTQPKGYWCILKRELKEEEDGGAAEAGREVEGG